MAQHLTVVHPRIETILLDTVVGTATNVHNPVSDALFHAVGICGSLNTLGGTWWFEDTDATKLTGTVFVAGNTVFSHNALPGRICSSTSGLGLAVNTTGGGFHGTVQFIEVKQ